MSLHLHHGRVRHIQRFRFDFYRSDCLSEPVLDELIPALRGMPGWQQQSADQACKHVLDTLLASRGSSALRGEHAIYHRDWLILQLEEDWFTGLLNDTATLQHGDELQLVTTTADGDTPPLTLAMLQPAQQWLWLAPTLGLSLKQTRRHHTLVTLTILLAGLLLTAVLYPSGGVLLYLALPLLLLVAIALFKPRPRAADPTTGAVLTLLGVPEPDTLDLSRHRIPPSKWNSTSISSLYDLAAAQRNRPS